VLLEVLLLQVVHQKVLLKTMTLISIHGRQEQPKRSKIKRN
jgi:hypothetical protein